MKAILLCAGILVSGLMVAPASATTYTFAFASAGNAGNLVNGTTFTQPGVPGLILSAYAFNTDGTTTGNSLYAKYTAGNAGETGLGTTADATGDHEIIITDYVQIDFSNVKQNFTINSAKLVVTSDQSPDAWQMFVTKTTGGAMNTFGSAVASGNASGGVTQTIDITSFLAPANANVLAVNETAANPANVLVGTLTLDLTAKSPEPGTMLLLVIPLIGLVWKRRKAVA